MGNLWNSHSRYLCTGQCAVSVVGLGNSMIEESNFIPQELTFNRFVNVSVLFLSLLASVSQLHWSSFVVGSTFTVSSVWEN